MIKKTTLQNNQKRCHKPVYKDLFIFVEINHRIFKELYV